MGVVGFTWRTSTGCLSAPLFVNCVILSAGRKAEKDLSRGGKDLAQLPAQRLMSRAAAREIVHPAKAGIQDNSRSSLDLSR